MAEKSLFPNFSSCVSRKEQERLLNQKGKVFWFTGLSGSGKSTIALAFEKVLFERGYFVKILDGDNIRSKVNSDLGFSIEDRAENIRRIAEIAKLFLDAGTIVLCTFISPTREIRDQARQIIGPNDFLEVFVDTPLAICEERDVKGLYKKARAGKIKSFTGIDSPYEIPDDPMIVLKTSDEIIEESVKKLVELVVK